MNDQSPASQPSGTAQPRRPWSAPRVQDLPRLTELTLVTGDGIPGGGNTGGSTVIP